MQGLSKYYKIIMILKYFFKNISKTFLKNSSKVVTNTVKKKTSMPHVILFAPLEYFKLTNIAIVQVLGSTENEQCF